eukprot:4398210-Pyramimonas_sp.AAC.1
MGDTPEQRHRPEQRHGREKRDTQCPNSERSKLNAASSHSFNIERHALSASRDRQRLNQSRKVRDQRRGRRGTNLPYSDLGQAHLGPRDRCDPSTSCASRRDQTCDARISST